MLAVLAITGPIYVVVAIGYLCTRLGLFARSDMRVFGKYVVNLALPALLFNALSQRSVGEVLNPVFLGAYALGSVATNLAGLTWARRVARKPISDLRRYERELSARLDSTANALGAISERVRANPRRVVFAFASSEAGSRFRCRLDRRPYRACVSPRAYRVGLGRHTFRAFAIDAAGNADPSPARFEFRLRLPSRR